jgi:hypothetical protein
MSKKISELNETFEIAANDIIPVVNESGTEKIKYSTIKTDILSSVPSVNPGTHVLLYSNNLLTDLTVEARETIHEGDAPVEQSADQELLFENNLEVNKTIEFEQNLKITLSIDNHIFTTFNSTFEEIRVTFSILTMLESDVLKTDTFDVALSYHRSGNITIYNKQKIWSKDSKVTFVLEPDISKRLSNICKIELIEFLSNTAANVSLQEGRLIKLEIANVQPINTINTKIFS